MPPLPVMCVNDFMMAADVMFFKFSGFLSGGYLEVLESTKETPDLGVSKTSSISEEIYDDVEYSRKEV